MRGRGRSERRLRGDTDVPLIELLLQVGGQHGVAIVSGGVGVDLRHGGRVAAGGGLLVRESTLFLLKAE